MRDRESFKVGRELGYLTHGHPSGYLPAACLAMLIGRIIDGNNLNEAIDNTLDILKEHPGAEETTTAVKKAIEFAADPDLPHNAETVEKLGEEWVGEEALAIAIYCALVAGNDFDLGIRLAVNHSGDSDSTGAIAGNILGALLGRKAIAERWLSRLELRQVIEQVATDLFLGFEDDDEWWRRYPGY
jgi:ADP-ribosylglycohydrolase